MDEEFKILIILKICKIILAGDKEGRIKQWLNEFKLHPEIRISDHKWGFVKRAIDESIRSTKNSPNPNRRLDHATLFGVRIVALLFSTWSILWLVIAHELSGTILPLANWAIVNILICVLVFGASFTGFSHDIYWLRKHWYGRFILNSAKLASVMIVYPIANYVDLISPICVLILLTLVSWEAYWNTRTAES